MANNTGYRQWLRRCRLTIAPQGGGTGTVITKLRIGFVIEKSMNDTPNYSQISIMNPAHSLINSVTSGDKVTLECGYENGNFGMIFTGDVVQAVLNRQDVTDRVFEIAAQDGDEYLNSSFVATTINQGTSADQRVDILTSGYETGILSKGLMGLSPLPRGKVMFGYSADYLRDMSTSAHSQMYVDDGVINVAGAEDYAPGDAVELRPDTGLIGAPEHTDDGISGQCLLNPSIKLNTLIHVDTTWVSEKLETSPPKEDDESSGSTKKQKTALPTNGLYRIVKLTYKGDTHGDDWYCNFDAVAQDGVNAGGAGDSPSGGGNGNNGGGSGGGWNGGDGGTRTSIIKQAIDMWR